MPNEARVQELFFADLQFTIDCGIKDRIVKADSKLVFIREIQILIDYLELEILREDSVVAGVVGAQARLEQFINEINTEFESHETNELPIFGVETL